MGYPGDAKVPESPVMLAVFGFRRVLMRSLSAMPPVKRSWHWPLHSPKRMDNNAREENISEREITEVLIISSS